MPQDHRPDPEQYGSGTPSLRPSDRPGRGTLPPTNRPGGGSARMTEARALAIALAWMFFVQLVCVVLWDAAWLSRADALVHWLAVGVLPPALALWSSGAAAKAGKTGG